MVDVVLQKILAGGFDVLRRAQLLGQGALHEPHDPVADETAVVVVAVLRQVAQTEHVVAAHGQIAYRVE